MKLTVLNDRARVAVPAFRVRDQSLRSGVTMEPNAKSLVTAVELANEAGMDPKRFRVALRAARLSWHRLGERWEAERGGQREAEMRAVLKSLAKS